ncbi:MULTISPECIES: L,D-transpeptidase family protein [unclassified Streptomyces]|uniref:L,D-transpeptidase family protein n=1 Tax=unclassified Streptomyces TaxID=2593676 RepID=UPI0018FE3D95|nr:MULTISPECIES: L,D-transpeptidase family protein [unclassified Streptomyces]
MRTKLSPCGSRRVRVRGRRRGAGAGAVLLVGAVCAGLPAAPVQAAPPGGPDGGPRAAEREKPCTAGTGPYQRQVEAFLKRLPDGRQSTEDCVAIRRFQRAHQLERQDGYAGLETYRQVQIEQTGGKPNADGACPERSYKVVCVDQKRQLLWVQTGSRTDFGPVPMRTGRYGQETRPGMHRVVRRVRDDRSQIYDNAPMPYAQYFDRGQAIHGRHDSLYDGGGSAGCVNLKLKDARELWERLRLGDHVYVWGRKPGT